jgi:hypothetical protein
MACQTIITRFRIPVTTHTPTHRHFYPWFGRRVFTLADVPMTSLAGYLSQDHMTPMGEKNVIRLPVDMSPWDLLFLLFILPDFFFFWAIGDGFFMAFQTDGDARQSGKGLGFVVAVAGVALQSLLDMFLMAKGDGLLDL